MDAEQKGEHHHLHLAHFHLESLSASLEHQQQQVSAQHKRKAPKKCTAQILPSVVQTIPLPQLIRMQQQQTVFNNNNLISFLQQQQQQQQQQMYCNLLPPLPMVKAPPTQYNNVFCCTKYAEHRRLQNKGRLHNIQRIANGILVQSNNNN